MLKFRRSGFTLVEVVLACSLFAVIVVGIILAINRSFVFMNNIKLSVRAANFAREGVEMMYNIRDTNWRKHSGQRDKLWLYLGEGNINNENGDVLFSPGIYILKERVQNGNSYFYAERLDIQDANIEDFYSNEGFWTYSDRDDARLEFDGQYSYYEYGDDVQPLTVDVQDSLIGEGLEFYRIVRIFGVYKKNVENSATLASSLGMNDEFRDGTPAEMRFCVKVFYVSQGKHSSEICSVMTNFME